MRPLLGGDPGLFEEPAQRSNRTTIGFLTRMGTVKHGTHTTERDAHPRPSLISAPKPLSIFSMSLQAMPARLAKTASKVRSCLPTVQ